MADEKGRLYIFRNLVYLTQVGLSLAMPLILCCFGAAWLQRRFQLGSWVIFVGIILGVGGAVSSFRGFMHEANRQARKKEKKEPRSFNDRW